MSSSEVMVKNPKQLVQNSEIQKAFKLIEENDKISDLENTQETNQKVLVLGITGSGKSTLLQWFAGDDTKLFSEEIEEGSNEFTIVDKNQRIGNSTMESMTIHPELVQKYDTNFYDCPGFSDTRSTSYDIAISYFIKKLCDRAESLKIFLVVSYSSVQKGMIRDGFTSLLEHAAHLMKNVDKYSKSIALIVTKVENNYKQGTVDVVSDEIVIRNIARFIREARDNFTKQLNDPSKNSEIVKNQLKICNILLDNTDEKYNRIGLFRRPNQSGPLSEITLLQNQKKHIENTVKNKLEFTVKGENDFGYTVSDRSKNEIHNFVDEISKNIQLEVVGISEKLKEHFDNLVKDQIAKIKNFVHSADFAENENLEAQAFADRFDDGKNIVLKLVTDIKSLSSINELDKTLKDSMKALQGFEMPKASFENISRQLEFFRFLQNVSPKTLRIELTLMSAEVQKNVDSLLVLSENVKSEAFNSAETINLMIVKDIQNILNQSKLIILKN